MRSRFLAPGIFSVASVAIAAVAVAAFGGGLVLWGRLVVAGLGVAAVWAGLATDSL